MVKRNRMVIKNKTKKMKSILLVIRSNFRTGKAMTLLCGVTIFLSVILSNAGILLLQVTQHPFDRLFDELKASHINLLIDVNQDNPQTIGYWFQKQPEVERIGKDMPYFLSNGPLIYKQKKFDNMIQLTEYNIDNKIQDKLFLLKGKQGDFPGHNEIWLPKYIVDAFHIVLGDTISIPVSDGTYPFKVTAIVADPLYGSGMVNPTRVWIGPGELPFIMPVTSINNNLLGIRLKNKASLEAVWSMFIKENEFNGTMLSYSVFKGAYLSVYQIIGNIILVFSLLALIISITLIKSSITRTIFTDYKDIGLLKTIGFTPRNIVITYILQYFFLTLLSVISGTVIFYFIGQAFIGSVSAKLGLAESSSYRGESTLFFTAGICMILILITACFAARRAGNMKPITGITSEDSLTINTKKRKFNLLKTQLSLPVILSIKDLISDWQRSMVQGIIMSVTIFIVLFTVLIGTSFEHLKHNKSAWGFENGDIQISRKEGVITRLTHEQLMNLLREYSSIEKIIPYTYVKASLLSSEGRPIADLNGKAYVGTISESDLSSLEGKQPVGENEISLCTGTASRFAKKVGDSMVILIEGERKKFIISGLYQDIGSMGQGFRMNFASINRLNPVTEPSIYVVRLRKGINPDAFKIELLRNLGETISIDPTIDERIAQTGVVTSIKTVLYLISLFFISILIIAVGNHCFISIKEKYRSFGLLKTSGWTPSGLSFIIMIRLLFIMFAAFTFTSLVLFITAQSIISSITASLGIVKFPLIFDGFKFFIVFLIILFVVVITTWVLTNEVRNVKARLLITQ